MALYPDSTCRLRALCFRRQLSFDRFDIACAPHYVPYPENELVISKSVFSPAMELNSQQFTRQDRDSFFATQLKQCQIECVVRSDYKCVSRGKKKR